MEAWRNKNKNKNKTLPPRTGEIWKRDNFITLERTYTNRLMNDDVGQSQNGSQGKKQIVWLTSFRDFTLIARLTLFIPHAIVRCDIETLNNGAQAAFTERQCEKKAAERSFLTTVEIHFSQFSFVAASVCAKVVYLFKSFLLNFSTSSLRSPVGNFIFLSLNEHWIVCWKLFDIFLVFSHH